VVQQKLNQVREKDGGCSSSSKPEDEELDPDTARRIGDLHKYSQRAASVLAAVPELIDRLEALSPLHAQAAEMSLSLVELETVQQQMVAQLGNNSRLLK
jgi:dynactin-2